jgi:hypothetical protein
MSTTNAVQIAEFFGPEIANNIGFFSGGRTAVQTANLAPAEITAILTAYNSNLNLIKRVSTLLYNDLVNQQQPAPTGDWLRNGHNAALKFAMIAKATLASQGGTKPITWPPLVGQIGVQWLDPFLVQYSGTKSATYPCYTDYTKDTWNLPFNVSGSGTALAQILGTATYTKNTPPATSSVISGQTYYQANNTINQRELWFIFQNGVLEIGTTPDIQQWIIQTSLTQAYNTYSTHSLVYKPIDDYRTIFQYNTPGIIPVYNDMGIYFAGLPQSTTTTHVLPLLGMAFYETALLPAPEFV